MTMDNPFDRYDIDPREGIAAITQRLKELAEEASDDERERLRAAWEELTMHPDRRFRAALFAHPESYPPLGLPPPLPRRVPAAEHPRIETAIETDALVPRPSLVIASGACVAPPPTSLDDDPLLRDD
jgi:hypothetical protein